MTFRELEQSVTDLNDGINIDDKSVFISAVNLAMRHINRIIPAVGEMVIDDNPPIVGIAGRVRTDNVFHAERASAVIFRARGSGKVSNGSEILRVWGGVDNYTLIRILLSPAADIELTFSEIIGVVADLAVFRNISDEKKIPEYGDYIIHDLRVRRGDFISPDAPPYDGEGLQYNQCYYRKPRLYIPCGQRGDIHIRYRRKQAEATHEALKNNDTVDIDIEIEDLLPLLASYYIWLEEEPAKAGAFLQMFNTHAALARNAAKYEGPARVRSINNW